MTFDNSVAFQGTWRNSQQRVLDRFEQHRKDHHIHIVAAPGSGKTTLGLELILRQNQPCLVLVPTLTIRQQWVERFTESFLSNKQDQDKWISTSLKACRPITVITVQALYHAVAKKNNEDEFDWEAVLIKSNIAVLCLDEAHHLRKEWVKVVEQVTERIKPALTIALTATPPLDASDLQWRRYRRLCGEIDEEIFVPELIKDGNLCPHQDYVLFSWPNEEESKRLKEYAQKNNEFLNWLRHSEEIKYAVMQHPVWQDLDAHCSSFLENQEYLKAFLSFSRCRQIPLSKAWKALLDERWIPFFDLKQAEHFIQGFLFEDTFTAELPQYASILKHVKQSGVIVRKKVMLCHSEKREQILTRSSQKLENIQRICHFEKRALGERLRLLILTDTIHEEDLTLKSLPKHLGAASIFRYLQEMLPEEERLAILSGTLVVVPKFCAELLKEDNKLSITPLVDPRYVQIHLTDNKEEVRQLTQLLNKGDIRILIGTRSLLGEGWDAPCITSMILASTAATYVTSNQMRGRAIRWDQNNPDKTANIWHLATIELEGEQGNQSKDLLQLQQRFEAFLGLRLNDEIVENGWQRLQIVDPPYNQEKLLQINKLMLMKSLDRDSLQHRWNMAIAHCDRIDDVLECTQLKPQGLVRPFHFYSSVKTSGALLGLSGLMLWQAQFLSGNWLVAAMAASGIALAAMLNQARYLIRYRTKESQLMVMCASLLEAMKQAKLIDDTAEAALLKEDLVWGYLNGGTLKQRQLYAQSVQEMLSPVDNPRYLLMQRIKRKAYRFYCVPEALGKNKENAQLLCHALNHQHRDFVLIYTRSLEGRKALLKARLQAMNPEVTVALGKMKRLRNIE